MPCAGQEEEEWEEWKTGGEVEKREEGREAMSLHRVAQSQPVAITAVAITAVVITAVVITAVAITAVAITAVVITAVVITAGAMAGSAKWWC